MTTTEIIPTAPDVCRCEQPFDPNKFEHPVDLIEAVMDAVFAAGGKCSTKTQNAWHADTLSMQAYQLMMLLRQHYEYNVTEIVQLLRDHPHACGLDKPWTTGVLPDLRWIRQTIDWLLREQIRTVPLPRRDVHTSARGDSPVSIPAVGVEDDRQTVAVRVCSGINDRVCGVYLGTDLWPWNGEMHVVTHGICDACLEYQAQGVA